MEPDMKPPDRPQDAACKYSKKEKKCLIWRGKIW